MDLTGDRALPGAAAVLILFPKQGILVFSTSFFASFLISKIISDLLFSSLLLVET